MRESLIILESEAIPVALQICAGFPDYEVLLFDPVLAEPAITAGLQTVHVFTSPGGRPYDCMAREAHTAARALEAELDSLQYPISGVSIAGWQHLSLYYLLLCRHWYEGLWERLGPQLLMRRVHVPVRDHPAELHFASFIPALTLIRYLRHHGVGAVGYDYGAATSTVDAVPDLRGVAPHSMCNSVLTHLPTCMHDAAYFKEEIRAAGKQAIDVESRHWDVPTDAQRRIPLTPIAVLEGTMTPEMKQKVAGTRQALAAGLRRLLAPLIELQPYDQRQCDHIVHRYAEQLITYFELRRHFQGVPPEMLLLSEHDAGMHGPLISFSAEHGLPVLLLPHSKIIGDLHTTYRNVLALTHPIQGVPIEDANGEPVRQAPIRFPEQFLENESKSVDRRLRTLSLLLNGISLSGVPYVPCDAYIAGIKRIVDWCAVNEVALKIRGRPGYPLTALLKRHAGVGAQMLPSRAERLEEHAQDCDACVMYDMPTTAALHFLQQAIPVLNPIIALPTKEFLAIAHAKVIVTESLDSTLERLTAFKSDSSAFAAFAQVQNRSYRSLFDKAVPLRDHLASKTVAEIRGVVAVF